MICHTVKELEMLNTHLQGVKTKIDRLKEELDETKSYSLNLRKAQVTREIVEELERLLPHLQEARKIVACVTDDCTGETATPSTYECESEAIARECESEHDKKKVQIKKILQKKRKFALKTKKGDKFKKRVVFQNNYAYDEPYNNNLESFKMDRFYLHHICVIGLASTLFACGGGGGGGGGGAPAPAVTNPSTSGGGTTTSSTSSGGAAAPTFAVNWRSTKGNNFGLTFLNDDYGRGVRTALDGLDFSTFKKLPNAAQRSGRVSLAGYFEVTDIHRLSPNQFLGAASTLSFDFSDADNSTISGSATNFDVYFNDNKAGNAGCTPSTCVVSKVRDVEGTILIKGTESITNGASNINLTLEGELKDGVVTRNFNGISLSGTFQTNQDNSVLRATVPSTDCRSSHICWWRCTRQ